VEQSKLFTISLSAEVTFLLKVHSVHINTIFLHLCKFKFPCQPYACICAITHCTRGITSKKSEVALLLLVRARPLHVRRLIFQMCAAVPRIHSQPSIYQVVLCFWLESPAPPPPTSAVSCISAVTVGPSLAQTNWHNC
jgi:hypothetical protein